MADHTLQSTIEIAGSLSPSLQSAINAAVSRLEEMSKETLEAAGASAQLAAKISTQETVLKNLEQGYADYIVTGQEGTEEAEQLASTIQELSGELTENRGTLDAAEKAARALSETMDDAGGEAETLRSTISKQEDTLQQLKQRYVDVATEQGETSDEARELARQIQDLSSELHENKTKLSDAEYAADKLDNSLEEVESSAKKQTTASPCLRLRWQISQPTRSCERWMVSKSGWKRHRVGPKLHQHHVRGIGNQWRNR